MPLNWFQSNAPQAKLTPQGMPDAGPDPMLYAGGSNRFDESPYGAAYAVPIPGGLNPSADGLNAPPAIANKAGAMNPNGQPWQGTWFNNLATLGAGVTDPKTGYGAPSGAMSGKYGAMPGIYDTGITRGAGLQRGLGQLGGALQSMMVQMRSPNGMMKSVPQDHVAHYTQLGARMA